MKCLYCSALAVVLALSSRSAAQHKAPPRFSVPPGFTIEQVAGPPLVEHPMMANFDERGRLFVADSAGINMKAADLLKELPNRIRVLPPANDKGLFTDSALFADRMSFPQGVLWYRGAAYSASPPSIWKLEDPEHTGKATLRRELVTKFGFTGNAADIHGPFLGPDGRLYWCDGRHGHDIARPEGATKGKAARIFRCKPDGSEVEVVCGGGMDNPVEIAFTDECEPLVTVDILHNLPARNDAIIFAIEGGVYPWHEVSKEFPRTGDLLPAVENLGWVAPAGLTRYRGATFGKEYQGNLFSAQFNRNRIQRHVLTRDGASFKIKTEDFLTSTDRNFHPTDVLEDADGSLLVIDTGGWFRIGCPTSKIAQPEIKGAIYRIRKMDAPKIDDPRGLRLEWVKATPRELTARLDDPRFMVRDRAIDELAQRGEEALPALDDVLNKGRSAEATRNAVWALTRMQDAKARALVRRTLVDGPLTVRLAAAHSAGLHRDEKAAPLLEELLKTSEPALQRQAATALGRIKKASAIHPIMDAIQAGGDRFLEHALIYALIQIEQPDRLVAYLKTPKPRQQRAALIAMDQMPGGGVTREHVTPLLRTSDAALRKAALEVIARRPGWGKEIVELLREWLAEKDLDAERKETVRDLIQGLSTDAAIQSLVTQTLAAPETAGPVRVLLLESITQAPIPKLPPEWLKEVGKALDHEEPAVVMQAIASVQQRGNEAFDAKLRGLGADEKNSTQIRLASLAALDARVGEADEPLFGFLFSRLTGKGDALEKLRAARVLGRTKLERKQLDKVARAAATLGPLELPHVLAPFAPYEDEDLGKTLIGALEKSSATAALNPAEVRGLFVKYPASIRDRIDKILDRHGGAEQAKRLEELRPLLDGGEPEEGRKVFFNPRALCATCHVVQGKGGGIGPDLSKIGAIRAGRDLLESVVFPSSSFARGFEPWTVETRRGTHITGLLTRETSDAIVLTTTERQEIRISRADMEQLSPAGVSIMPQGIDAQLSPTELRDLLAFLQSLR